MQVLLKTKVAPAAVGLLYYLLLALGCADYY